MRRIPGMATGHEHDEKCGSLISVQKHDCLSGFSTEEKSVSDDPFQP